MKNPLSVIFIFLIWVGVLGIFTYEAYKIAIGLEAPAFKFKTSEEMFDGDR